MTDVKNVMGAIDVKSATPWPQDELDKALISLSEEYRIGRLKAKDLGLRVADIYNRFIIKDFHQVQSITPIVREDKTLSPYSDEEIKILAGLLGIGRHSEKSAATLRENIDHLFDRYDVTLYPYILSKYVTNPNAMVILINVLGKLPSFASIVNAQLSGLVFSGVDEKRIIPRYTMMKNNVMHGAFISRATDGQLMSVYYDVKGYYLDGKPVGMWEYNTNPPKRRYFIDGVEVEAETYYILIKDTILANTSIAADPVGILIAYNPIF